jgi:hypothetical protein
MRQRSSDQLTLSGISRLRGKRGGFLMHRGISYGADVLDRCRFVLAFAHVPAILSTQSAALFDRP